MKNLQQDLLQSQKSIGSLLNDYNRTITDMSSTHLNRLHSILSAISTFDKQVIINQSRTLIDEPSTAALIETIATKINNAHTIIPKQELPGPSPPSPSLKQQKNLAKSQQKRSNQKKSGIFDALISKFSNDKKATQMILPDDEPKCYYDPVTKSYIFEGEEPVVPKSIPKPPSAIQKSQVKTEMKRAKSEDSQISQLTAPPAFKRKTTGNTSKAKAKAEKQAVLPKELSQPLTFELLVQNINQSFNNLLDKLRGGFYEINLQNKRNSVQNDQFLNNFIKKIVVSSQDICRQENKIIERFCKTLTSDNKSIDMIQKVLSEVEKSTNSNIVVLQKLESLKNDGNSSKTIKEEKQIQTQVIVQQSNSKLKKKITIEQKQHYKEQIEKEFLHKLHEESQICLRQKIEEYKVHELKRIQQQLTAKYEQQIKVRSNLIKQKDIHILAISKQIDSYKLQINQQKSIQAELQKQIEQQTQNYQQMQSKLAEQKEKSDKILSQLMSFRLQVSKITSQLTFYNQKKTQYISKITHNQPLLEQIRTHLQSENDTLSALLTNQQATLSEIFSTLISVRLDQIQKFNRGFLHLKNKIQQVQATGSKFNQGKDLASLTRSIIKLKGLLEICKNGKAQAEEKCGRLQIQCERLKKRVQQLREEESLSKSYLSRLKINRAGPTQNQVLSQQDREQLTQQIGDLQRELNRKGEALRKTHSDLQDLLVNYEMSQSRLLTIQKRQKAAERQIKTHIRAKQQLNNKIKLLQLKIYHQKERENEHQQQLKTAQSNFQKKIKLLKHQLDQSYHRENNLKVEFQEAQQSHQARLKLLQESHARFEAQMIFTMGKRDEEIKNVHSLLEDSIARQKGEKQQNDKLRKQKKALEEQLSKSIKEYSKQVSNYQQERNIFNNQIENLLTKYKAYQGDYQQFKKDYEIKLYLLQTQLIESQRQSSELLSQIGQYSSHIQSLNMHIKECNQLREAEQNAATAEVRRLGEQLLVLNNHNIQLRKENESLKNQIAQMSYRNQQLLVKCSNIRQQSQKNHAVNIALQSSVNQKVMEISEISTKLAYSQQNLAKISSKFSQSQLIQQVNSEKIDQLTKQIEEMNLELQNKLKQIQSITNHNTELQNDLKLRNQQISQLQTYKHQSQQQITQLQHQNHHLQMTKETLEETINKLSQEINHQRINSEVMASKLNVKQQQMAQLLLKIQQLEQQAKIIEENDEIEGEMQELLKQIDQKQNLIDAYKEEIKQKNDIVEAYILKLDELNHQHSKTLELLHDKQQKVSILQQQISSLTSKLDEETLKKEKLQFTYQNLRQNNSSILEDIESIKLENTNLENQKFILRNQVKTQQKLIQGLQNQITSLKQSSMNNTQLELNYKNLLDENAILLNEKVELMKSNDYLVSMNQKLVASKTHTSIKEYQKSHSQIIPPSPQVQSNTKHVGSQILIQKNETKGFLGTISSFFLTPSETDRLKK